MKNSYKAILLAALGLSAVSAAQAQDLLIGFNDAGGPGSAQNDYVIDVGSLGQFTTSASLNFTFSGSLFNTAFGSDANALNEVAVGAAGGTSSGTKTMFQTGPFLSNFAAANVGSSASLAESATLGEYSSGTAGGWSYNVAVSPTVAGNNSAGSVASISGNPMGSLSSGILTETLYEAIVGGTTRQPTLTESTLGTLSINANNDTISFTGSAVSVPEPGTYGLLAGAGLLLVSVRRQFIKKNA